MAIDNAEKRKNISGIQVTLLPGVTSNASKDSEWRAQSGWGYGSIAVIVITPIQGEIRVFVLDDRIRVLTLDDAIRALKQDNGIRIFKVD